MTELTKAFLESFLANSGSILHIIQITFRIILLLLFHMYSPIRITTITIILFTFMVAPTKCYYPNFDSQYKVQGHQTNSYSWVFIGRYTSLYLFPIRDKHYYCIQLHEHYSKHLFLNIHMQLLAGICFSGITIILFRQYHIVCVESMNLRFVDCGKRSYHRG